MKTYKYIFLLILFIVCTNCKNRNKYLRPKTPTKAENQVCNEKKEALVKSILETKELQTYIFEMIQHEVSLSILETEFITTDLKIYANKQKVSVNDSLNSLDTSFNFSFSTLNCLAENISFTIWLPIEHTEINGEANFNNNTWFVTIKGRSIVD